LLAGEAGDETPAADVAAALEPAIDAQQVPPGREPGGLAFDEPPEHDAVAEQQGPRHVLDVLGSRLRRRRGRRRPRTARERPATRLFHAEFHGATAPPPAGERPALAGRHQQRAQAPKAVGAHEAERDQFGQRLLDLRP
jgi:hypothetical protein